MSAKGGMCDCEVKTRDSISPARHQQALRSANGGGRFNPAADLARNSAERSFACGRLLFAGGRLQAARALVSSD